MSDLGLISVLPPAVLLAVVALGLSFLVALLRVPLQPKVLSVHVLALVAMLFGTPVLVESLPSGTTTYLHAGFTEYIARTGGLAFDLDARFSWPGFFALAALLSQLGGIDNALRLATWAPVYFNLLFALGLWVLYRGLAVEQRLAWAAIWLFELANWIGQDYFAPQALAYFLYLVVLGGALLWFRVTRPHVPRIANVLAGVPLLGSIGARLYGAISREEVPAAQEARGPLALILLTLVVVFGFISISHQLTPFLTAMGLVGLAAMNRVSIRGTAVLMSVMATAWVAYAATPFLAGHLPELLAQVGEFGRTVSENVTGRILGSADHQLVLRVRLAVALGLWALALLGAIIRMRRGAPVWTLIIAAVAPLPLLFVQPYGGEIVLRLYLFSLPFVTVLAAGIVFRGARPLSSWLERGLAVVVLSMLTIGFFTSRYGNERADSVSAAEFEAVQAMYAAAPAGSLFVTAYNAPWKYERVEEFSYISISREFETQNVGDLVSTMSSGRYPAAFLLLTRREEAYGGIFGGLQPGAWDRFVTAVETEPRLRLLLRNDDAALWTVVRAAP